MIRRNNGTSHEKLLDFTIIISSVEAEVPLTSIKIFYYRNPFMTFARG